VMNHISVNAASFAYLVCPILTTVLAFIFLNEKLNRNQWMAVAMSALSCFLLSFNHLLDVFYSLIIALSFALYLIAQPKNKSLDKFLVLTVQVCCSAIILLPFYPFSHGPVPSQTYFFADILIIAVLFTIVPLWLNLYALKGLKSSAIGILLYINPLMNFAIAILYYNEKITSLQAIAYAIIFLSVILFNVKIKSINTRQLEI
jgi:chloramphenicol-sensitive protein RarD